MFSSDNLYQDNTFVNNESGVAVMYSKKIRMLKNVFSDSRGPAAYGILLKDISDSDIRANRFTDNTVGVYVEGTTRSLFASNHFENNGWAMRILGDSDGNDIAQNNFISNTLDVATNATINANRFSSNYWSRYTGFDLDHNGFGDDPYHPVQLTSMLMEKYGASVLLINSFFFTLLDQVESVMPVLTPKAFVDPTPLMNKVVVRL
jgi:nitrous oxidase accessory protein